MTPKPTSPSPLLVTIVDVETTGLSPRQHEVIELAMVQFTADRRTGAFLELNGQYQGLQEPDGPVPRAASRVHGLTLDMVAGHQLDHDLVRRWFQATHLIVAHNAPFDRGFLSRLYPACDDKPWLCSMRGIRWKDYGCRSRALQKLVRAHGITVNQAHRALADCQALLALLRHESVPGRIYLQELLAGSDLMETAS